MKNIPIKIYLADFSNLSYYIIAVFCKIIAGPLPFAFCYYFFHVYFSLSFRFENLKESLQVQKDNTSSYVYDNTTSPECNAMMEDLEEGSFTRFIWSILKPYIRGKILYTPDTPATRRLVSIVNETFAPIGKYFLFRGHS